ncbi:MAG TPA: SMI1/KNR4 family protein [Polyangia bacterium]|nr:SMI1/KNR4 family protein [Polyangia bacterium]
MKPEDFAGRLRALVAQESIRSCAAESDFLATEERLGIVVPADIRTFYRQIGGSDEATPLENGWVTFWPLDRWESTQEFGRRLALIADHGTESWWYAIPADAEIAAPIFIVDRIREPRRIAGSFGDFAEAVMRDDSSIYAQPLPKGGAARRR